MIAASAVSSRGCAALPAARRPNGHKIVKHRPRIHLAAAVLLLSIVPSPADAVSAKVRQGDKQVAAHQYKKALNSFRAALKADPNDAEAMTRIGDLHASGQGVPRSD